MKCEHYPDELLTGRSLVSRQAALGDAIEGEHNEN